jgi:glycosyltransferase involved in cell wall biosynthesis
MLNPISLEEEGELKDIPIDDLLSKDKVNVFWIGRSTSMKGYDVLEKIVEASQESPFQWILNVGVMPPGLRWKSGSIKNVRMISRLPRVDQLALWAGCNTMLCTSRAEGFCLAVFESLALGVPVVANVDCKVLGELRPRANFDLVSMTNPQAVLSFLQKNSANTSVPELDAYFSVERMIRESETLYTQLLSGGMVGAKCEGICNAMN